MDNCKDQVNIKLQKQPNKSYLVDNRRVERNQGKEKEALQKWKKMKQRMNNEKWIISGSTINTQGPINMDNINVMFSETLVINP